MRPSFIKFNAIGVVVDLSIEDKKDYNIMKLTLKTSQHSILKCELIANKKEKNIKVVLKSKKYIFIYEDIHTISSEEYYNSSIYSLLKPIKLSFYSGSKPLEYTPLRAIEEISHKLEIGDSVALKGTVNITKSNDEQYDNFYITEVIKLHEQYELPFSVKDSQVNIETEIVFKEYKIKYKLLSFYIYFKNNNMYNEIVTIDIEPELDEVFQQFQYGQLLKLYGKYEHFVELIEVDQQCYCTNNVVKRFLIQGGDILDTVYTEQQLENKAQDVFIVEDNSNLEYGF